MHLSKLTILSSVVVLTSACGSGAPPPNIGIIGLTSQQSMSFGYAMFVARRPSPGCVQTTVGSCDVVECTNPIAEKRPEASAGTIVVEGTLLPTGFEMAFGDSRYAYGNRPLPALWNGGETLTVSAPGADVPAFSGKTVLAPNPITVTAPTCEGNGVDPSKCRLARNADLPIAWTGGASTSVSAMLNGGSATRRVFVSCRFASSPGVIPAAVMARFTSDAPFHFLQINGSNQTKFTSGDYEITLEANNVDFGAFVSVAD